METAQLSRNESCRPSEGITRNWTLSPDALWWSIAVVTAVGYGDVVPVTHVGRAFAYVLMIGGTGLFGAPQLTDRKCAFSTARVKLSMIRTYIPS